MDSGWKGQVLEPIPLQRSQRERAGNAAGGCKAVGIAAGSSKRHKAVHLALQLGRCPGLLLN